jgi:hypothetical protein
MIDRINPTAPILDSIKDGRAAILLSGRNLRDLAICPDTNKLRPLIVILSSSLKAIFGIAVITYDRATGFDLHTAVGDNTRDLQTLEAAFKAHNLLEIPQDENEVAQAMRGISEICRLNTGGMKWSDGRPMQLLFLLDFAEHLIGCSQGMMPTDAQAVPIELAAIAAQSLALRNSGNLIAFQTQDPGKIDSLVRSNLYPIHLPQPDLTEKINFIQVATALYDQAKFEGNPTIEQVAFLTSNTPNRGLEGLLRASHRNSRSIGIRELIEQKSADVLAMSEGSLASLDMFNISTDTQLQGVNSAHAQKILSKLAQALAVGNPNMPASIILVGPPGTGKTEMALIVAKLAGVCAYQINSPKRGIVGETERLSTLQQRILAESIPNLAFADEVTELLPLERSNHDGDSGATRAVAAALLTALGDEGRRGKSLFVGTTNCPWRIGAAMRSRFVFVPVLHPLERDYPAILIAVAQRVDRAATGLSDSDPAIVSAAKIFYDKGANPRQIRSALSDAILLNGGLNSQSMLFAAQDCMASADRDAAIYSDLWAVSTCTSKSFLPWTDRLATYPFPAHLQGLVDLQTGDIDRAELQRRIEELKPNVNV